MSQRCQESVGREATEDVPRKHCKFIFFLARRREGIERWMEGSYGIQRFSEHLSHSSASDAQINLFACFLGMEEEKEKPKLE